ncbi:MAG: hypothetical protein R2849_15805 [Thermomicrobiales bacterium]
MSVMPGLDKSEANQAIPAMQSINREIQNPFFLAFFGALIAGLAAGGLPPSLGQKRAGNLCFLAAAVYVFGLPADNHRQCADEQQPDAKMVPGDPGGSGAYMVGRLLGRWTAWNSDTGSLCNN